MIDLITIFAGVASFACLFYFFTKSKQKFKDYKQCRFFEESNTTKQ